MITAVKNAEEIGIIWMVEFQTPSLFWIGFSLSSADHVNSF